MTNALVLSLFRGSPHYHPIYDIQFPLLLRTLTNIKDSIDMLYLVDNQYNLSAKDMDELRRILPKKVTVMYGHHYSHWEALEMIVPRVREDNILFIDADTIIYNGSVVHKHFDELDDYEIVSLFDSSGKRLDFDVLEGQRRFAPYFMFVRREALEAINLDLGPYGAYTDSFSWVTEQLLFNGAKAKRLPDDRDSCLYNGNLELEMYHHPDSGYYHIRNLAGGLHLVSSFIQDKESYDRAKELMPKTEAGRLVMWVLVIQRLCGMLEYEKDTISCSLDLGISDVEEYYQRFINYHSRLKTL